MSLPGSNDIYPTRLHNMHSLTPPSPLFYQSHSESLCFELSLSLVLVELTVNFKKAYIWNICLDVCLLMLVAFAIGCKVSPNKIPPHKNKSQIKLNNTPFYIIKIVQTVCILFCLCDKDSWTISQRILFPFCLSNLIAPHQARWDSVDSRVGNQTSSYKTSRLQHLQDDKVH